MLASPGGTLNRVRVESCELRVESGELKEGGDGDCGKRVSQTRATRTRKVCTRRATRRQAGKSSGLLHVAHMGISDQGRGLMRILPSSSAPSVSSASNLTSASSVTSPRVTVITYPFPANSPALTALPARAFFVFVTTMPRGVITVAGFSVTMLKWTLMVGVAPAVISHSFV